MEKDRINPVKVGSTYRMTYSRIDEILDMPNLIEIQKDSFNWFIKDGILEIFRDIMPITDYSGNLVLEFVDFTLDAKPKYTIEEAKERDTTYAASLKVKCRLHNKELGEIKEQDIFMGDFPLMTHNGTFIINGAERVIVSQLVRSPSIYYSIDFDKIGKKLISATVIPNRGVWLEYETDSNNIFNVRVDKTRKIPITVLIRALGIGDDEEILELFGREPKLISTIEKDVSKTYEEGLIEIYKRIRPGEPPTVENAEILLKGMFFDPKRYDLAKVGRYKFNKKLHLRNRVNGAILAEHVIDSDGEIVVESGTKLTPEICDQIQDSGAGYVFVKVEDSVVKVLTNLTVSIDKYLEPFGLTSAELDIKEKVYYPYLKEILDSVKEPLEIKRLIKSNINKLIPKNITMEDIMASISYTFNLDYDLGSKDDIDHLGNRRIRSVGELLQNHFRIGLTRLEKVVRERMTVQDLELATPQALINIRPVTAAIKEFFGSSQLSQFMDQTNPLSELANKRRLSALGPGGLSRDRAGFEVRDVHSSHYGRMCPIETPEGPNIGLINSLATYARVNEYGFIEAPYRLIDKSGAYPVVSNEFVYITADEEENYALAQANEPLDSQGRFINKKIACRYKKNEFVELEPNEIDLMDVSPKQIVSVSTALIPFLENDDVTRALMGSNMQRQAVPLLKTDSPIIGTGMENKVARDSGVVVISQKDGIVQSIEASKVVILNDDDTVSVYKLAKFLRSNQGTCINQRPIVDKGQRIRTGDIIADGPSTDKGELALGKNPLIGFMTWEGYNYEDAILLSEKLVEDDVYTSIHIEEYEIEARDTKLGPEEITRDIPNISGEALNDLDENGIIRIGAEVRPSDILVGKVTPKGETDLTAEERLLRAIFGEKAREVRDMSLKVPHGESGTIVDVKVFTRDKGNELPPGVNSSIRVYIAQKRKISVGDKMAGRHGNKGVVSRVLPIEDMPFLPNGRPLDIVLNPLGVPSRMNIGQVLEIHLGLAARALGFKVATPVFDGAHEEDIMDTLDIANDYVNKDFKTFEQNWKSKIKGELFDYLKKNKSHRAEWSGVHLKRNGKIKLRDGRTGEFFDNEVTVGYMHYLKLHHLVDDKIHARSTGPYSLVTQQPLGGKAQFGGQRFGEMEVWALEAYGAAYALQEILTVKSDDIIGRVKTYEAIVKGENVPKPGIPESFKVLLMELQALSLDIRVLLKDFTEVKIEETLSEEVVNLNLDDKLFDDSKSYDEEYMSNGFKIASVDEMDIDSVDTKDDLEDKELKDENSDYEVKSDLEDFKDKIEEDMDFDVKDIMDKDINVSDDYFDNDLLDKSNLLYDVDIYD